MDMGITMAYLLEQIPQNIVRTSSLGKNRVYEGLGLLYAKQRKLKNGHIYMGYASILSGFEQKNIGLILVNDLNSNLSASGIDYIELDKNVNIDELFEELIEIWHNYEYGISLSVYNTMIQINDLKLIIKKTFEIMGNPIIMCDSFTNLVGYYSDQEIEDPSASYIMQEGHSLSNHIRDAHTEGINKRLFDNTAPIIVNPGLNKTRKRILGRITLDNNEFGNIIVLEYNRRISSLDVKILGAICNAVSNILASNRIVTMRTRLLDIMYRSYLLALLKGESINMLWVNDWLQHMGWRPYPHNNFYIMTIIVDKYMEKYDTVVEFMTMLERAINCFLLRYDKFLIMIIKPDNNDTMKEYLKVLTGHLSRYGFKAGISAGFDNIKDISPYFLQAKAALNINAILGKQDYIGDYSKLAVYDILLKLQSVSALPPLCKKDLDRLIEYDKQYGTEYYRTLYIYLKCSGNKVLAADQLCIHKNTMGYRLNKIVDILDLDLDDGEKCQKLFLSYKINELAYAKQPFP
ncbi:MAG: helix-turn-helix domain-containing protein [Treponema sp.]|jgi:hypothetical protein|nr:helix-turn-helix domain-containing protein [Treponema sp.]